MTWLDGLQSHLEGGEVRIRERAEMCHMLIEVAKAAEKVYYGPSKGHLAVKAWRELGTTLSRLREAYEKETGNA